MARQEVAKVELGESVNLVESVADRVEMIVGREGSVLVAAVRVATPAIFERLGLGARSVLRRNGSIPLCDRPSRWAITGWSRFVAFTRWARYST